ncbi:hypothetical protein [Kiloniella sp. b19]|uniref:hypothetical protein n=1 Tax=Kiloniella sp. GXU_MW_B19 TaxID=3141326 RepID=UPI0031D8DFB7
MKSLILVSLSVTLFATMSVFLLLNAVIQAQLSSPQRISSTELVLMDENKP